MTETELRLLVALVAIGGIVVGGVVAGAFALLTGWLDNRREHKRWLREQVAGAAVEFLNGLHQMVASAISDIAPRQTDSERLVSGTVKLQVLGNTEVRELGYLVRNNLEPLIWMIGNSTLEERKFQKDAVYRARNMLIAAVQRQTGIPVQVGEMALEKVTEPKPPPEPGE